MPLVCLLVCVSACVCVYVHMWLHELTCKYTSVHTCVFMWLQAYEYASILPAVYVHVCVLHLALISQHLTIVLMLSNRWHHVAETPNPPTYAFTTAAGTEQNACTG